MKTTYTLGQKNDSIRSGDMGKKTLLHSGHMPQETSINKRLARSHNRRETPKGLPYAQAPKSTPTLKCTSIVCWFNTNQHLFKETLQEACDLSTHAHLSFLVPVIQLFKFPLYVIN